MPIIRSGYAARPRHGTTTQRGYGHEHQLRRAHLLPQALGTACPICDQPMTTTQKLELDHTTSLASDPNSFGDRIVHATCNRRRGGV